MIEKLLADTHLAKETVRRSIVKTITINFQGIKLFLPKFLSEK